LFLVDESCFALLPGTNRNKTRDEVLKAQVPERELMRKLGELKRGEEILWVEEGDFRRPPRPVEDRIVKEVARLGLQLDKR
jgi:hypothetical protein